MSIISRKAVALTPYIAEVGENTLIKQSYHMEKQSKKISL
jgi:hypothetical protein